MRWRLMGSWWLVKDLYMASDGNAWAIKMEVFMMAQGVWDAIETPDPIDSRRDKMALAAIYQGIGEDTLLQLGAKKKSQGSMEYAKNDEPGG
ncbi:hypothetical protein GH714_022801 [Hevea brasiliensis]|uniref:DUF4219 domain-containing protein n=1 Tax=Hevea brasiliensis TaxID=3981 RepID=A0A6A6LZV5_HEVBR|nr:hypothetical protein GH714_022801 [Hevea brasiliensis]